MNNRFSKNDTRNPFPVAYTVRTLKHNNSLAVKPHYFLLLSSKAGNALQNTNLSLYEKYIYASIYISTMYVYYICAIYMHAKKFCILCF